MTALRRFLGVLWTFAAALPAATVPGEPVEPSRPGATAAGGTRSDARATPGPERTGLAETALRDLRTPVVAPPSFHLNLTTRVIVTDGPTIRPSGSQTVRRSNPARAPPALH